MPRTHTRYINFQKFEARGESAVTVIKLMMACNDLQLGDMALSDWMNEKAVSLKPRQNSAKFYFVRTQLSHLFEGLKVIDKIKKDSTLLAIVKQCDVQTQESFEKLEQFLPGGAKRIDVEKLVGRVRSNLTFHYDESGKLVLKAIADRAARSEAQTSSVTRGSTAHLWHFKAADDVLESIFIRQIWNIPRNADVSAEYEKIIDYVHQIFLWFVDFSGEFIWKYCGD